MSPLLEKHTHQLRQMMQRVGISSFKALSQMAGVSDWQVKSLRQGRITEMQVQPLLKLSRVLQVSLPDLLAAFSDQVQEERSSAPSAEQQIAELRQEYDRLQAQLQQQQAELQQTFQQSSLQVLEPWLIQWSAAAYAAQQNPQAPAVRLLPLLRPIEQLLQQWQVEPTATVGSEIPYDPQFHQLMDGVANPGDMVRVRYAGYTYAGKLLHRAKVSPVSKE
jgi:molecular chaperone GrpE (heat shock protein)